MIDSVHPLKLTVKGTYLGNRFIPLTTDQSLLEQTWERFLSETLGPKLRPEELEALERAIKKFKGLSDQKLENPYFWESWAPTWAEYSRRNLQRGLILLNRFGCIKDHLRIISLGAGSCWQEVFLARYGCSQGEVFGVDFSFHMINQGNLLAKKMAIKNSLFVVGKVEDIPIVEQGADLVISLNVLDIIPDIPKVLGEVKRILKNPPHNRYFFVFPLDPRDRLQRKAEDWKSMIVEAGLNKPILFYLPGKNYKGKSLRWLGLTDIDPGWKPV